MESGEVGSTHRKKVHIFFFMSLSINIESHGRIPHKAGKKQPFLISK